VAAISDAQKGTFLAALQLGNSVKVACEQAGVSRRGIYYLKAEDPEFDEAWKDSIDGSVEVLEDEVRARALDRKDPKSHIMLIFLLKKHRPEYRENYKTEVKVSRDSVKEFDFSQKDITEAMAILAAAKAGSQQEPQIPE
jgi:hypothetical protein